MARLLDVDRGTLRKWISDEGMPVLSSAPTKKGTDYTFDQAAVFRWQHDRGVRLGTEKAKKAASSTALPTMDDPETGAKVIITSDEVLNAMNRKIIANADKAERSAARELIALRNDEGSTSANVDVEAMFAFYCGNIAAALASLAADLKRGYVEAGFHPAEANRRVDGPMEAMIESLDKADPFTDPTKEFLDEDDAEHAESAAAPAPEAVRPDRVGGEEPPPPAGEYGTGPEDAGRLDASPVQESPAAAGPPHDPVADPPLGG